MQSKLASLLKEFPDIGAVNFSGYSKFAPNHGVEHFETNDARPRCSHTRPLFGAKKKAAQQEFKPMLAAGIVSRSEGLPWAATPLHLFKKQDEGSRPCGDFRGLNLKTIADSYVIPHLHGLNYN